MDRMAAAILVALAALAMNGGLVRNAMAGEAGTSHPAAIAAPASPTTLRTGSRSERVLSLLLTLEALRSAPGLLDSPKV